jgi:ubiquinone/menaquinone biosynthesis C-methylase UbiE
VTEAQPEIAVRYDRNADRYDDVTGYNRDAAERLVRALPSAAYRSVLDAGCGTGNATMAMLARFAVTDVVGVDLSAQMLEQLRHKLAAHPGVHAELHVGDVLAMPVGGRTFDAVLASMVLHWISDRPAAIRAMAGALAPGGVLGIVAPGPGHDVEYTEVLRSVRPAVPSAVIDVFDTAQVFPDATERAILAAGLEPVDVWVERRVRRVPPERYMARITAVGSHVWSRIMSPAEAEDFVERVTDAVRRAAGPRGFEYTFTKTYAIARRPR